MNSMSGWRTALTKSLPSFQQVIQEGESVQIMWILEQPSAGYL